MPRFVFGITPAYAGKSKQCTADLHAVWDHPRLCGEKDLLPVYSCLHAGSPPPMRGKDLPFRLLPLGSGITPAYAGKSAFIAGTSCEKQDHPRLCGEKFS